MGLGATQLAVFSTLLLIAIQGLSAVTPPLVARRVSVVKNEISPGPSYLAFAFGNGLGLTSGVVMASSDDGETWSQWISLNGSSSGNPVAVSSYVAEAKKHLVFVFMLSTDNSQLYVLKQSPSDYSNFSLVAVTQDLPRSKDPSSFKAWESSQDPIQAVPFKNHTYIFVRSLTNTSQLFWNRFNGSAQFTNAKWARLGDDDDGYLTSDPSVAVNTFLGRLEVFAVFDSGHVLHSWQDGANSFHGAWQKLGGVFSPRFDSAPVVHQMGHSDYNGVLNLFVRGVDGGLHHISQTTCDKVDNPWGPCTWGLFHGVGGGDVPAEGKLRNPFAVTHSVHHGIEVFTVGKKKGHLFHVWQRERDSSYSDWEDLGPLPDSSPFTSIPALLIDKFGWWEAFSLNSSNSTTRFHQHQSFGLSVEAVDFGKNVTAHWDIPPDQATHMDWIGVYPQGADDHGYVDFSYVGGDQNPLKDPVPKGSVEFRSMLPNGTYDFRYMVNKEYFAVLDASLSVSKAPVKDDWVSLFDGISLGLGGFNTNVSKCAEDGEHTLDTFKAAFDAFEDRKIFDGLHLFAEGLSDFRDALVQCNETDIVKILVKFIEDLVSCTEDVCAKFLIDVGLELVILYEHIYEIYGDIYGATNSFKIKAFEQGGICIGRVTNACLTLE